MHLSDYLSPSNLNSYNLKQEGFYNSVKIFNSATTKTLDLSRYEVAILGAPFSENNTYEPQFADQVRNELANLSALQHIHIVDLGNCIKGNTLKDSLVALKDILALLSEHDIFVVVISNTTLPVSTLLEYQFATEPSKYIEVDSNFSVNNLQEYLPQDWEEQINYCNIGFQNYYAQESEHKWLKKHNYDAIRLGEVRRNLPAIEPLIRDADFINFSLNALKHQEAPGQREVSPNGFYSEEFCQIARYAGTGDHLKIASITDFKPTSDEQTIKLTAQIIWFLVEGFGLRITEDPLQDKHIRKFNVSHGQSNDQIVFYKSEKTERWWIEIPKHHNGKNITLPASYKDYTDACNQEIPYRWIKAMQKHNISEDL